MNPLIRRSFLRLTAALSAAMAFQASAALPDHRLVPRLDRRHDRKPEALR